MNFRTFSGNELVQDAVVRNLEIIREAAKKIPGEIRSKYSDIERKKNNRAKPLRFKNDLLTLKKEQPEGYIFTRFVLLL